MAQVPINDAIQAHFGLFMAAVFLRHGTGLSRPELAYGSQQRTPNVRAADLEPFRVERAFRQPA